jgi:hypothetical protein
MTLLVFQKMPLAKFLGRLKKIIRLVELFVG